MAKPITLTVRILNPMTEMSHTYTISAHCPQCLKRRGEPKLVQVLTTEGHTLLLHRWVNKCGHEDTPENLMMEIESQCERDGCTIMASDLHFPYCGQQCMVSMAVDLVSELRAASMALNPLADRIKTLMECSTRDGVIPGITQAFQERLESNSSRTRAALFSAQISLMEAAEIANDGFRITTPII